MTMTKSFWMNGRLTKILVSVLAVAVLSGCSYLQIGQEYAAKGAAKGIQAECALSMDVRRQNFDAIVAELAADQSAHRPSALDCNGDGQPDF